LSNPPPRRPAATSRPSGTMRPEKRWPKASSPLKKSPFAPDGLSTSIERTSSTDC
jgi:hypothetical protein